MIIKPPYFGSAYYPESWPREQINKDLDLMQSYGMNTVRIAEFAWSTMEPREGQYDFSLFREVVDKCRKRGMAVIMCTPSATLPAWMEYNYPEVCSEINGKRTAHGTRRMSCPTSRVMHDKTMAIVERMAQEFCHDDNIIGWQIDNEISATHSRCSCPNCVSRYHDWLRAKYHDIGTLNRAWGNYTWSLTYTDFEEVPFPSDDIWNNATHKLAWIEYKNDVYAGFIKEQADILHRYVKVPVGTDMMLTKDLDIAKVGRSLDISQFNHYIGPNPLGFWTAVYRGIHDRKFWVTETSTCYNGSNQAEGPRMKGFCTANTLRAFAGGGEANLYWLWRGHYAGHEIGHGSVVDTWGREMPVADEVRQLGENIRKLEPMINGTAFRSSGVALVYSHLAHHIRNLQPLAAHMEDWTANIHGYLENAHFSPDVITPAADLSSYKVILSINQYTLDEQGFAERILPWVEAGGTWVAGPLTDVLTPEAVRYTNAPYGHLEVWARIYRKYMVPAPHEEDRYARTMPAGHTTDVVLNDGTVLHTQAVIYDAYEVKDAENSLARYAGGDEYLNGLTAITETNVGRGRIIVLGAQLDETGFITLLSRILKQSGILPLADGTPNVHNSVLSGSYGTVFTSIECLGQPGRTVVPFNGRDILTDHVYRSGETLDMQAYQCLFIKES